MNNYINDFALKYHEKLIKDIEYLFNETNEICEHSRYMLGKYAIIRADILMKVMEYEDNKFLNTIIWY